MQLPYATFRRERLRVLLLFQHEAPLLLAAFGSSKQEVLTGSVSPLGVRHILVA